MRGRGGHSSGRGRRLGDASVTVRPPPQVCGHLGGACRAPLKSHARAPGSGASQDPTHPWASLLLLPCPAPAAHDRTQGLPSSHCDPSSQKAPDLQRKPAP